MSPLFRCLIFATAASLAAAAKKPRPTKPKPTNAAPPSTGNDWTSLENGMEFQPSSVSDPAKQRALEKAQKRFLEEEAAQQEEQSYSYPQQTSYLDTKETYYDAYAQAWRYVGFYTDCNPAQEDRRKRGLEEENGCQRYLLWAAYVDLGYTGKGIGEYQFWDTYNEFWDTSACETIGNVGENGVIDPTTCKRMDCHMPDTETWQLLGYFKEPEYTDWFEQLFKHEGCCVWQQNEYDWMYENYGVWPEGCQETERSLSDGTYLYYDTKATANATMGYGLYTDAKCSKDYMGDEVTVEQVLMQGDGGDDLLNTEYLEYWNDAMEIYRVCQPCRAYSLNGGYNGRKLKLTKEEEEERRRLEDGGYDPNNGLFQCNDAAGYTNVNQCMKFATKTDMYYATTDEVMEAAFQGGVTTITMDGRSYGEYRAGRVLEEEAPDWTMLWIALSVLGVGILSISATTYWIRSRGERPCRRLTGKKSMKEPLITDL